MHCFCDVQIVWRAVLFLGQKGRLWVPFRLLVVGVRIRIVNPIWWQKQFYKHLSLPFCPNFFFYYEMRSISKKHQSNALGSHTRSVSSQSLLAIHSRYDSDSSYGSGSGSGSKSVSNSDSCSGSSSHMRNGGRPSEMDGVPALSCSLKPRSDRGTVEPAMSTDDAPRAAAC